MTHGDPFFIIPVSRARVNAVMPKGSPWVTAVIFSRRWPARRSAEWPRENSRKDRSMNTAQWLVTDDGIEGAGDYRGYFIDKARLGE